MKFWKELLKGLWKEIPVFRVVLGLCPTIAVTTSVENAMGMGAAATFVLICSNTVISLLRNAIPNKVRIPCYIVIAATFVTITDLVMNAYAHELHKALGIFIPLIVVNCIILGRAEAFAGKNSVLLSIADGIGMGVGFTLALIIIATCREAIGNGTFTLWSKAGLQWHIHNGNPALLAILAPGGFLALGMLLGVMNLIQSKIAESKGKTFSPPTYLGCRFCTTCVLKDK